jgi:hypothetical protein
MVPADGWDRAGVERARSESATPSVALASSGYYVSRRPAGTYLVIDAGRHGYLNGGHAHADALSLVLSIDARQVLIDPGTFTYTVDPVGRDRFRSSLCHNTLTLDGQSSSVPAGPFHWQHTARAHCDRWVCNARFDYFEGRHDGYAPHQHRRTVVGSCDRSWLVVDWVNGSGVHRADLHWHLAPAWRTVLRDGAVQALHEDGGVFWIVGLDLAPEMFRGDADTGLGWCSPLHGALRECSTVRFRLDAAAPLAMVTLLTADGGAGPIPGLAHVCLDASGQGRPEDGVLAVRRTDRREWWLLQMTLPKPLAIGEVETDARMVHVREDECGRVASIGLVDASYARRAGPAGFSVSCGARMPDLAIERRRSGQVEVAGSVRPPRLELRWSEAAHTLMTVASRE